MRCIFSLTPLQFASQGAFSTVYGCLRSGCWALPQFHGSIPSLLMSSRVRGERGAGPSAPYSYQINCLVFRWISSLIQLSCTSPCARQGGRGCKKREEELQLSGRVQATRSLCFCLYPKGGIKHLRKWCSVRMKHPGLSGPLWLGHLSEKKTKTTKLAI